MKTEMSKVSRKVSIAAAAIKRHIESGNWIGASYPRYIKEMRKLRGTTEIRKAFDLANARMGGYYERENRLNFEYHASRA